MKKILSIVIVALLTVSTFAQEKQRRQHRSDLTPDQIAELQTKRMTLHLELNKSQQQQILEINKKNAQERKQKMAAHKASIVKGEKPNSEELFKIKSTRLDSQIANQKEIKSILNDEQFKTWKRSRKHRAHKMKKRRGLKKMQKQRKIKR